MRLSIRERFEQYVDRSGGPLACHPWTGGTFKSRCGTRRGKFRLGRRTVTAARVALALHRGAETLDEVARVLRRIEDAAHGCDNAICVNGRHLGSQSRAANVQDYYAKQAAA